MQVKCLEGEVSNKHDLEMQKGDQIMHTEINMGWGGVSGTKQESEEEGAKDRASFCRRKGREESVHTKGNRRGGQNLPGQRREL